MLAATTSELPPATATSSTTAPDRADLDAHAAWVDALAALETVDSLEAPIAYERADYRSDGWRWLV